MTTKIGDHASDLHLLRSGGQDLNLRPLGYEPREQATSAHPAGRSWTPVDEASSQVSGPSMSGDVHRDPRSSLHVLLTFC
jgi:hypothetical protein